MKLLLKHRLTAAFFILVVGISSGNPSGIDHSSWNKILSEYVSEEGIVRYGDLLKNKPVLQEYLTLLSKQTPNADWSPDESLAYWINAYNAFTIALILDHYPLKSIMDIKNAWDKRFIELQGQKYSLNQIEYEIIRKEFDEPRIHFALVCAATSCPLLLNEAYLPETLDAQLERQTALFINDPQKNELGEKKIRISQIFNWFEEDFTKTGTLVDFMNRYSEMKIEAHVKIDFLEYDWGLNGA